MADPMQFRFSNSSDESPLQEDPSDSEHDSTPLEDHDEVLGTLDPRNSQLSLVSGAGHSLDDRRHHHRGLAHRDFFKYLVEEGNEAKKLRKVLRAALERLDGETRRAQEAERRALELAQRFKLVNEARLTTQQDLDRVHAELRMYKVQLDNAQREINRGSDLLKDIEAQRDSAEAAAARARSTARRLKEQQIMMHAREEGRKEGYQEGLKRGYQQARGPGIDELDVPPAGIAPLGSLVGETPGASRLGDFGRTDPLDGLSMLNLSTPPRSTMPLASSFGAAYGVGAPQPDVESYGGLGAGAEGSRFREHMSSPSTMRSALLDSGSQAGTGWRGAQDDELRYIRPTLLHNAPASPQHSDYAVPPDGYIPSKDATGGISLPPPHELNPQRSMSTIPFNSAAIMDEMGSATVPAVTSRDYPYIPGRRGSPRSFAESLPSTTISQFDLVSSPKTATRALRERSSGLSAIAEVSSMMEHSPGTEGRVRSTVFPDPVTFPVPGDRGTDGSEMPSVSHSRSNELNQRIADELRYDDPDQVEQWRRSTASQSLPSSSRERLYAPHRPAHITTPSPLGRPSSPATPSPAKPPSSHRRSRSMQSPPSDDHSYLGAGSSSGHRRTASSTPISIRIEPPSGPGSNVSPATVHDGMLLSDTSRRPLPPPQADPFGPERPQSRGYPGNNHPYGYGMHSAPGQSPVYDLPTRPALDPAHGYPVYPAAASTSSVGYDRPRSRGASVDFRGTPGDFFGRPRTPSSRPSSAAPGERPSPSARPLTPGQPSIGYPDPQRVPSVLRSPSRASSRQSLQPDPARPSSRASADRHRSLSLHAGSTPAMAARPLSGGSEIRRVPSASSINSETSAKSGGYQRYDPSAYIDPAFLASSEDLTSVQSPNTLANTRANAAWTGPGPSKLRSTSPSFSYASMRS